MTDIDADDKRLQSLLRNNESVNQCESAVDLLGEKLKKAVVENPGAVTRFFDITGRIRDGRIVSYWTNGHGEQVSDMHPIDDKDLGNLISDFKERRKIACRVDPEASKTR